MVSSGTQTHVNQPGAPPAASLDLAPPVLLHQASAGKGRTKRFEVALTAIERVADFFTIAGTVGFAYKFYPHRGVPLSTAVLISSVAAFALMAILMLDREGAYRRGNGLLYVKETERVLRVSAQMLVLTSILAFIVARWVISWRLVVTAALITLALLIEKQAIYRIVRALHARGFGVRPVVIYGAGYTGRRVFSALARSPKLGLKPVVIVDDDASKGPSIFETGYRRERPTPVVQGPITSEMLQSWTAGMLVIAIPSLDREKFVQVANAANSAGVDVAFVPNNYVPTDVWIEHADIDGLLLASFSDPPQRYFYQGLKRCFDFVAGSLLLLLCAPFMAAIALLIRVSSPGPVIFRQERVGKNGSLFRMYKFRSMYADVCRDDFSPAASNDERITKIGRWLRRTSLDEMPQLLNVVRGEMSLVGPRPEMPFIVQQYLPRHRQRLHVQPGITGLWQISADRAYLIHENLEYDLYYIKNCNFFMDVAILVHTIFFAMRGI